MSALSACAALAGSARTVASSSPGGEGDLDRPAQGRRLVLHLLVGVKDDLRRVAAHEAELPALGVA